MSSIEVSSIAKVALGTFVLTAASLASTAIPVLASPPTRIQLQQMRVCKYAVGTKMYSVPLSQIKVEAPSPDEQGISRIDWQTTRGVSGYCRLDSRSVIIDFKMDNNSGSTAEKEPIPVN